ncbi:BppU family phage baseplate upper protein [Listeria seeligeri]|uniref:BppU family phage baseplate upper protein n=1 Tax=Listeria seeligeri TaxID=1640 RepID=UPI0022EB9A3B|nr:BppU family phage baseplate upper protein [Listeria seeligeri]
MSNDNKIYKSAIFDFDVSTIDSKNNNSDYYFSTQDLGGSSQLVFNIKKNAVALPLSNAASAKMKMVMADGSQYIVDPSVSNPLEGQIKYSLTDDQLKHHGKVYAELYITYPKQVVQVHKFGFTITQALIDSDITPVITYYVQTWEEWEAYFQLKMDVLEQELDIETARIETEVAQLDAEMDAEFEKLHTQADSLQEQFDSFDPAQFTPNTEFLAHTDNLDIHVTVEDKTNWNAKETMSGAQAKADQALVDANAYTDSYYDEYVAFEGAIYLIETQTFTWDISKLKRGVYIESSRYTPGTGALNYGFDEVFYSKSFIENHAGLAVWHDMPGSSENARKEFKFTTTSITGYPANSLTPNNNYAIRKIRVV